MRGNETSEAEGDRARGGSATAAEQRLRPYGATGPAPPAPDPVPSAFESPTTRLRSASIAVRIAIAGSVIEAVGAGWALGATANAIDADPVLRISRRQDTRHAEIIAGAHAGA